MKLVHDGLSVEMAAASIGAKELVPAAVGPLYPVVHLARAEQKVKVVHDRHQPHDRRTDSVYTVSAA